MYVLSVFSRLCAGLQIKIHCDIVTWQNSSIVHRAMYSWMIQCTDMHESDVFMSGRKTTYHLETDNCETRWGPDEHESDIYRPGKADYCESRNYTRHAHMTGMQERVRSVAKESNSGVGWATPRLCIEFLHFPIPDGRKIIAKSIMFADDIVNARRQTWQMTWRHGWEQWGTGDRQPETHIRGLQIRTE